MNKQDLKSRSKKFAIEVIQLSDSLTNNAKGWTMAKQIIRSSSSAANYRAVCRAKSDRDFISKMQTVIEECDETLFWLEIIQELGLITGDVSQKLEKEADELTAIFVSSVKTVKARLNPKSKPINHNS